MYWVEIRKSARRSGPPKLVPLSEVHNYTGFRTIYAFNDKVAEQIRAQGSTFDLRGVDVYSDTLFVDFDEGDGAEFRELLRERQIAHSVWVTGGRGVHIHIPLVPMSGPWVPAAQKQWLKTHATGCDTSYFHAVGLYRLPGTFHYKNAGVLKHCIEEVDGRLLSISKPSNVLELLKPTNRDPQPEKFWATLMQTVRPGDRAPRAWYLATLASECGMSYQEAMEKLLWWNENYAKPSHAVHVIESQVRKAYARSGRLDKGNSMA